MKPCKNLSHAVLGHISKGRCRGCFLNYIYKKRYGITYADWTRLFVEQLGFCALCGQLNKLVIDHDHKTGKVRGLVCRNCNIGLRFLDDEKFLANGQRYLNGG